MNFDAIFYFCVVGANLGVGAVGGIFSTLVAAEDHGHRVLVEQAVYEMKKGSYDIAVRYLDKALSVRIRIALQIIPMKEYRNVVLPSSILTLIVHYFVLAIS